MMSPRRGRIPTFRTRTVGPRLRCPGMSDTTDTPFILKTSGYLVSCVSVVALGVAAWPGAADAHLLPWLILGLIASVAGMACRWTSYLIDKRRTDKATAEARASRPGNRPVPGPV